MQNNQPQQFKNQTIWIILAVVVLAVATYGIWTALSNDNGNTNTNNTNAIVNQNANLDRNTNSTTNNNISINANTNKDTNTNSSVIDTSGWLTYTNEEYGYSVKYPKDWTVSNEAGVTFTNIKLNSTSGCFLKIHNPGFLGRGAESLIRGQDKTVTVLNKEFTRKDWLNKEGDLIQFGFEIQKDDFLLGIEGFVDKSFYECENILESIYESLELT